MVVPSSSVKEDKEIKVKRNKILIKSQPNFYHYVKKIEAPAKKKVFLKNNNVHLLVPVTNNNQ